MKKSTIERKPVGFRLIPAVVKAIKQLALNNDIQVNLVVEEALKEYLEKYASISNTYNG
ncbi:MAG: hypothetical protein HQL15_09760 [Candidatus Omnitrophica bacterium]|nr:hypothetical protein [Candidatus Omnitrophota bacterium]